MNFKNNLNSIFFYKGDINDIDEFFINNEELVYELVKDFNNKIKLKKIIDFDSKLTDMYFAVVNEEILNGTIILNDLIKHPLYENILNFLSKESIIKLYGNNTYEFTKRYGFNIILSEDYKYIETIKKEDLNKFFDIFKLKKPKIINLINLYDGLVDYNFLYTTKDDLLNNHAFDKGLFNIDLYLEFDKYLDINTKKEVFKKYDLEYIDSSELYSLYISLYKSSDYKIFSKYSSLIKELCYISYNKKRDIFKLNKFDFNKAFPFKIDVSYNMKRIINKKKYMNEMCYKIAYNQDSLNELKDYLVNKNIIEKDFDSNILFALLTDGVKGVKLLDLENVNFLMGKIYNYVSKFVNDNLDNNVSFDEYKNLPLNDECFSIPFDEADLNNIVNSLDLKKVFEGCIFNNYELFYNIMVKHDLLYLVSSLKLTDVCFNGDVCYSTVSISSLINNFKDINKTVNKNFYSMIFDYLKQAKSLNNPYNKYERVFKDAVYWIISDPFPLKSMVSTGDRINRCLDIYKKMLVRKYCSVPILSINYDNLVISNNNFYDSDMLVTGEKLGSCMRACGSMDDLFEYSLVNPNGFNITIKKDNELITRVAGVCLGNSIFLNELRDPIYSEYNEEYLFKMIKKYILLLIKKCYKNGKKIDQAYISLNKCCRNIKNGIVKDDMFLDLKCGKYGFRMNYENQAITLYGNISPIKENNFYYKIPTITYYDEDSIDKINILKGLKDIDSDKVDSLEKGICSNNWYIYYKNGILYSDILDNGNIIDYETAKEIINIKKNI